MKDTYVYQIGNNLYVNLTNRCSNRCTFCVRNGKESYEGYRLRLLKEPAADEVTADMGDVSRFHEVVFCGFGEPTYCLETMLEVAEYVHKRGGRTRLNTNGHGSVLCGEDIAPRLFGKIDTVNISLNAPTKEEYEALCRPRFEGAFEALLAFARSCKEHGVSCLFSAVDCIGEEGIAGCKRLADEIGIPLRVREYIG